MNIKEIDKLPSDKHKVRLWIQYGKKYNCLHEMPEAHELYTRLRKQGKMTMQEWNNYLNE